MKKIKAITETSMLFILTFPFFVLGFIAGSLVRMSEGGYNAGYQFWTNTFKSVYGEWFKAMKGR